MAHTPGPWRRLKCIDGDSLTLTIGADNPYGSGPWEVAHAIGWGGDKWGDCEANADLIAAAPDGLAFAKAVEKWEADLLECSEAWANGLPVFTQELYDSWMELQAMRNAFVAKAEGTP